MALIKEHDLGTPARHGPRVDVEVDGHQVSVPAGTSVLRAAALAGNGIANLPTFLVGPDIAAGQLQTMLTATPPTELGIFALYAPNRYLAAKTRVFIDFLVSRFGEKPGWDAFLPESGSRP